MNEKSAGRLIKTVALVGIKGKIELQASLNHVLLGCVALIGRQQTVTTLAMELCPIDLHGMIQTASQTNKRFHFLSVVRFLASWDTVQVAGPSNIRGIISGLR